MSDSPSQSSATPAPPAQRVEQLAACADRRWEELVEAYRRAGLDPAAPSSPAAVRGPRERALELRDHTRSYLLPRARDLEAPLLVAIIGPTGSGKSTLLNTLAGVPVSRTGVLRPTTRDAVAVGAGSELARSTEVGALADVPGDRLELHALDVLPGLLLVDAPDVDSVEHEDRALADRLLEAADLCIFVTTATRYADRVPWEVLRRAEERRLELVIVVNRMPPAADEAIVLEDLERLLGATGLRVERVVTVPEGDLSPDGTALAGTGLDPLRARLGELSADAAERRRLASDALAGALAGVAPLVSAVADDLEHESAAARVLLEQAHRMYEEEASSMQERLFSGTVLREQVIGQWHTFVGADQVTRFFASGIGRVRGALSAVLRGSPRAPVEAVQEGAAADISALVERHAGEAARRTAVHWSLDPRGNLLVAAHPELWSTSEGLGRATREAIDGWLASIAADVAERGMSRRNTARVAAFGVNSVAVALMLVSFTHTGGLTGAEAGIAAATAYLNQKLLNALFGEAAVQDMLRRARQRLGETLGDLLADERGRFEHVAGDPERLERLAAELRALAA